MLADDGDRLCGGDVEAGSPVFFSRDAVEVLFNDLLSPRESISAAHKEIMADRTPVGCPSAILKAAAAAPTAPCDHFLRLLPGLNRSSARACHFCPGAQPRTFLRLAAVTLTTGSPLLAAASSVIASPFIASTEDLNRPDDDPSSAIVEPRLLLLRSNMTTRRCKSSFNPSPDRA